uniref:Uncharacterized protein n=1 Tax=Rhizobium johnstonii (strain DSM 114642 / LMG 32736 / 3841) TaxID=216596 RepID=Q7WYT1_RHIJ3|nr:hypothetical protein [Rhizobium johnstonii 3841]
MWRIGASIRYAFFFLHTRTNAPKGGAAPETHAKGSSVSQLMMPLPGSTLPHAIYIATPGLQRERRSSTLRSLFPGVGKSVETPKHLQRCPIISATLTSAIH